MGSGGALVSGIQQVAGGYGVYLDVTPRTENMPNVTLDLSNISSTFGNVDVLVEPAQEGQVSIQLTPITITIFGTPIVIGYTAKVVTTIVDVDSTVDLCTIHAGGNVTIHTPSTVDARTDFVVDGPVSAGGAVTMLTAAGSILACASPGIEIFGAAAVLEAGGTIGQSATPILPNLVGQLPDEPIETAVGNLEAAAYDGGVFVVNTGALQIGGFANSLGLNGVFATGPIVVVTLDLPVPSGATTDTDENLVVTDGAVVQSTGGSVALLAGDNFTLDASAEVIAGVTPLRKTGAVLTSGNILIQGDYSNKAVGLDPDPGSGSTIQINGPTYAQQVNIWGNQDNDTINLQILPSPTFVFGAAGNDVINVSSDAPTDLGNVDAITGPLTVDGGAGFNTLTISDIGTASPKTATQTNTQTSPYVITTLTGLAPGSITYYATGGGNYFGGIFIDGGAQGNSFTIAGTQFDTLAVLEITTLNSGQGNDNVHVTEAQPHYLVINGEGGNDSIDATATQTPVTIFGGAGNDTIKGGSGGDVIFGDNGLVHTGITGLDGNEILLGLVKNVVDPDNPGNDVIMASGGHNIIIGDDGQVNEINAGPSTNATFITTTNPGLGGGNDTISVGGAVGVASLPGGTGYDTILGGLGADSITDQGGHNVIIGDDGSVTVTNGIVTLIKTLDPSLGGNDTITSNGGNDTLIGGFGNDLINENGGASTNNVIIGDDGMVTLTNSGQLALVTTTDPQYGGNDTVNGGTGNDTILGGAGNDVLYGGTLGSNIVVGNNGYVQYGVVGGQTVPVQIATTDPLDGGNNTIGGGAGDDILIGGAGSNTIYGNGGNDLLIGNNAAVTPAYNPDGSRKLTSAGWWERDVLLLDAAVVTNSLSLDAPVASAAAIVQSLDGSDLNLVSAAYNADGSRHLNPDGTWEILDLQATLIPDGPDLLVAGTGDSALFGGRGNDTLLAGNGNDTLVGGLGNDTITKTGSGTDLLVGDTATIWSNGAGPNVWHGYQLVGGPTIVVQPIAGPASAGVALTGQGTDIVPLGVVTPGDDFNPLVGVLINQTGGPALIPGSNTLHGTDGTTLQVFAEVVTDVPHHVGLLAGNDTLQGGTGNDILVGDDFTNVSPSFTLTPASTTALLTLTHDFVDVGASFACFIDRIHDCVLASLTNTLGTGHWDGQWDCDVTVVVDQTYSIGNDVLKAGGAGNNILVGDDMTLIAPTMTVPAVQLQGLDHALDGLNVVQDEFMDASAELSQAALDLRAVIVQVHAGRHLENVLQFHVDQILTGNDSLVGGTGHDLIVGDNWVQVAPTIIVTKATGPVPHDNDWDGHDWYEHQPCEDNWHQDEQDSEPLDWIVIGHDTLVGGGGTDVLVGDSVTVAALFLKADPSVAPQDFCAVQGQAYDVAQDMTAISEQETGECAQDVFVPSSPKYKSVIVQGDGDDLFENRDAQKLLINWSGSFDAFGSSPGVRFPTTWVNPIDVDFDAGHDDGDPFFYCPQA